MKSIKIAATALVLLIAGFILMMSITTAATSQELAETQEAAITMAICSVVVGGIFTLIIWLPWDKILKS